jgi:drug/metabolite transporter (DMT)-like permease
VQAVVASNLSLVALLSTVALHARMRPREWMAVLGVVCGVVLLVSSTRTGPPDPPPGVATWVLLAGVLGLAAVAYATGARSRGAALPGLLAGLSFGAAATAARFVGGADGIPALLTNPASYAVVLAGPVGILLYATALQRGSITCTSAMTIMGQTLAPAIAGWLLFGDSVRPGFGVLAVTGFTLTVAGALGLARHSHRGRSAP